MSKRKAEDALPASSDATSSAKRARPSGKAGYANGSETPTTPTAVGSHHSVIHATASKLEAWEKVKFEDPYTYIYGFGNELSSEAMVDALPKLGNTPMRCPYNLYAEQLSGTSFTTPRVHNKRTWLYKIRPSAAHSPLVLVSTSEAKTNEFPLFTTDFSGENGQVNPNQLRWKPYPIPAMARSVDFLQGLITIGGAGDPSFKAGCGIHVYCCNDSMKNKAFYNSDGDLLIVPQQTVLIIQTEMGLLRVAPGEFCVIPRGIKFAVRLDAPGGRAPARGYICEVFDGHFVIPDLGPIGANGLANPRHFAAPTAAFEQVLFEGPGEKFILYNKFLSKMFKAEVTSSVFDVVAWTGNYLPFKYDMAMFNTVNSVSFDHLDPSIFTVLTCQTTATGVAAIDFVVFPPRMAVQEDTFRPPYYHRNCMSEYMGNIMGQYDAKPEGFVPGSGSLHSCMTGHGPDAATYDKSSRVETAAQGPIRMSKNDLAFMFESTYVFKLTKWANAPENLQTQYYECWTPLKREFDPAARPAPTDAQVMSDSAKAGQQ